MTISEYHTHYLRSLFKISLILLSFHVVSPSHPSTLLWNMIQGYITIFSHYGLLYIKSILLFR